MDIPQGFRVDYKGTAVPDPTLETDLINAITERVLASKYVVVVSYRTPTIADINNIIFDIATKYGLKFYGQSFNSDGTRIFLTFHK